LVIGVELGRFYRAIYTGPIITRTEAVGFARPDNIILTNIASMIKLWLAAAKR